MKWHAHGAIRHFEMGLRTSCVLNELAAIYSFVFLFFCHFLSPALAMDLYIPSSHRTGKGCSALDQHIYGKFCRSYTYYNSGYDWSTAQRMDAAAAANTIASVRGVQEKRLLRGRLLAPLTLFQAHV